MRTKRGLSTVVETVILILVSIVAITIVVGVIIPWIKDNMTSSKSCLDLMDYGKITDELGYTCYHNTHTTLTIERSSENIAIQGFTVTLSSGTSSKRFDLKNNTINNEVKMLSTNSNIIIIPKPGESLTYNFTNAGNGTKAKLGVIGSDGDVCELGDFIIRSC